MGQDIAAAPRQQRAYRKLRRLYRKHLARHISLGQIGRQRLKTAWFGWGYVSIFRIEGLSLTDQLWLLWRCLRVDWTIPHGHEPRDCAGTLVALGARRARPGEVMIEAGCWQGGSTAKWSLACRLLGYRLHVYDSFRGVEARTELEGRYDYSGEYAATLDTVRRNVERHGDISVCSFHEGWFCNTMQPGTVPGPVRTAYIDCDLVKGTQEVLTGVMPVLSEDGAVVSQDGQIPVVAQFLGDEGTWRSFGVRVDAQRFSRHLLVFHVKDGASGQVQSRA